MPAKRTNARALLTPPPSPREALAPALRTEALAVSHAGPEAGPWIAPIAAATVSLGNLPIISLDDYLTLVDDTGRLVRSGKRGAIPQRLAPILERLHLGVEAWMELMHRAGAFRGSAQTRWVAVDVLSLNFTVFTVLNVGYPAQIRTGGITAYGSSIR